MGHVGFRWVSDEAGRGLRSGMVVSDQTCRSTMGLRSGMSVFHGPPMPLSKISDNNNIFVNSLNIIKKLTKKIFIKMVQL